MSRRSSNAIDPSIDREALRRERGLALAALLAAITIMFVGMGVAASSWSYLIQDNDEQELLFRGMQIVKGLKRMQVEAGRRPVTLEEAVKLRMLRREYLDPITERDPAIKGDWRYIHENNPLDMEGCGVPSGPPGGLPVQPNQTGQPGQPQPPGQPSGQPGFGNGQQRSGPGPQRYQSRDAAPSDGSLAEVFWSWMLPEAYASDDAPVRIAQGAPHGQGGRTGLGGSSGNIGETSGGPIVGVRSRSEKQSIRVFWGKNKYKEWCFTDQTVPDSVTTTQQMTYPKGNMPMPPFTAATEEPHPWIAPQR